MDVLFEILDYCSQNSRRGGHSWWSGGHPRWRMWLWRIAISPSFPNLLYSVCRSYRGRSFFLGGGGTSAVKDGIDLNTLRPLLHIDCSSGILLSSIVSLWLKNYFSLCGNIFSCIWIVEGSSKQEKAQGWLVRLWKSSIRILLVGNLFLKRDDRLQKKKPHCL